MAPSEPGRIDAALLRLRVAFHRRLARQLGLFVDESRLPDLVRAKDDRGILSELESQGRLKSDPALVRWIYRILGRNPV